MRLDYWDRWAHHIICHKTLYFIAGCLLSLAAVIGLKMMHVDNNYRAFIGNDNQALQVSDWLNERQEREGDSLMLLYQPADGDMFSMTSLLQYLELAQQVNTWPELTGSQSLFDMEKLVTYQDAQGKTHYRAAGVLAGGNMFTAEGRAALQRDIAAIPTIHGRFIASDNSSAAVILFAPLSKQTDSGKRTSVEALLKRADVLQAHLQQNRNGDMLHLTGTAMFEHAATDVLRRDIRQLAPLAVLLITVTIWIIYRSLIFVPLALLIILLPVITTAGISTVAGLTFSNLSVAGLLLVGTLAVADVMHIANSFFAARRNHMPTDNAMYHALRSNVGIITATTLTTMLGQCALLFSSAAPIQVMGAVIIIGSAVALLMAVMMLPFALTRARHATTQRTSRVIAQYIARASMWSYRHPALILSATLLLGCIVTIGLMRSTIADSLQGWFGEETAFYQSMALLDTRYLGTDTLTIAVEATQSDLLAARALPERSDETQWYGTLQQKLSANFDGSWLSPVTTLQAVSPYLQDKMHATTMQLTHAQAGDNLSAFSTETVARSGLMTRYLPGKKDYSLWLYHHATPSSFARVANAERLDAFMQDASPEREVKIGGIGLALAQLSTSNFWSVLQGSLLSFVLISAAMFVAFRSLRLGCVAILPNIAPIAVALGCWGLFHGSLNLAAITVFSVSMGIVVDDTIHIIMKYQAHRRDHSSAQDAFAAAMRDCGVGVFATTCILSGGFLLLGLSDFLLTAQKARLVGVTIIAALFFDVLILPVLLRLTDGRQKKSA